MKLSVVINTKNSEKTLERTLKSVSFADEIIIVDMMSDDKTIDIAKKYTTNIHKYKDVGYVEPARNFAIAKASGDWILIVDSDEVVSKELKVNIQEIVRESSEYKADCYYLPRKNMIIGKWLEFTGWWPDYVLRLFKNGHVAWSDQIHSVPITQGKVIELPAKDEFALQHYNYETVDDYLTRMYRYTNIQADELIAKINSQEKLLNQAEMVKAFKNEFLSRLFAREGIKDGMQGLSLSFLQGLSEVVVYLKAWEKLGKLDTDTELQQTSAINELFVFKAELNYWLSDYMVQNSTGLKKLYWMFKRKMS